MPANQLAIVTGASTGIGLELARCCAQAGFNLVIAADEPMIERVAVDLRRLGVSVEAVEADLATTDGVDRLCAAVGDRRSMRCWPMPASASARRSSIRTLPGSSIWSTPTSPARSI
ncbi:hypothetical protein TM239_68140 [Bradyrhizobium sp. TM239]|nr:hypothetical protein TM239_68140 [Bradyrhizobium sp. TM239]